LTYIEQIEFNSDSGPGLLRELKTMAESMGEPLVSGFDPKQLANDLRHVGLELVEDLDAQVMTARYRRTGATSLQPFAPLHIELARVPAGEAM
jgi:hypothetical protein